MHYAKSPVEKPVAINHPAQHQLRQLNFKIYGTATSSLTPGVYFKKQKSRNKTRE